MALQPSCGGRKRAAPQCNGKVRLILLPGTLCRFLRGYIKKAGVKAGSVFVTRSGRPLDRSNIWKEMKALCAAADVPPAKVFPHNLRHLFARTFYRAEKDLLRLADLLGQSSINTTRIYTMDTGAQHRRALNRVAQCSVPHNADNVVVRKMQVHLYVNNISYKIKAIFSRSFCQLLLDRYTANRAVAN